MDGFNAMVLSNRCPITRATFVSIISDVLDALEDRGFFLEHAFEDHGLSDGLSRPIGPVRTMLLSYWADLIRYVKTESMQERQSGLEDAAKERCRLLIKRLSKHKHELDFAAPNISESIFADRGPYTVSSSPGQSDQLLRGTGKYLGYRMTQDEVGTSGSSEMIRPWSKALKLAQAELTVRILPCSFLLY